MVLSHLGLLPLVDLGLRLGEGSGALRALPLVQAAARALGEMATFDVAGVHRSDVPACSGWWNSSPTSALAPRAD